MICDSFIEQTELSKKRHFDIADFIKLLRSLFYFQQNQLWLQKQTIIFYLFHDVIFFFFFFVLNIEYEFVLVFELLDEEIPKYKHNCCIIIMFYFVELIQSNWSIKYKFLPQPFHIINERWLLFLLILTQMSVPLLFWNSYMWLIDN